MWYLICLRKSMRTLTHLMCKSRKVTPWLIMQLLAQKKLAFKNSKCAKTTRVCLDSRDPANSVVTAKLAFREHFSAQLGGAPATFANLIDKDRADEKHFVSAPLAAKGVELSLPGCSEVAHYNAHSSLGAPGENNICGHIYRRFPYMAASIYFPLVLKSLCRRFPPLQWRGGIPH